MNCLIYVLGLLFLLTEVLCNNNDIYEDIIIPEWGYTKLNTKHLAAWREDCKNIFICNSNYYLAEDVDVKKTGDEIYRVYFKDCVDMNGKKYDSVHYANLSDKTTKYFSKFIDQCYKFKDYIVGAHSTYRDTKGKYKIGSFKGGKIRVYARSGDYGLTLNGWMRLVD